MTRFIFSLLFVSCSLVLGKAQSEVDSLLQIAKEEFRKEFSEQNFLTVIEVLTAAKEIDPSNQEVLYFLGYGYDRLNSLDGTTVPNQTYELSEKASIQFEEIISSGIRYTGEELVQDPYSKITSIWGSLALKYLNKNDIDSVRISFAEGKRRGGFHPALLELSRNTLASCDSNSILFSSGDLFTFSLLYSQVVDSLRTDIQIVDLALLSAEWYGDYLSFSSKNAVIQEAIGYNRFPAYAEAATKTRAIETPCCDPENVLIWNIDQLRSGQYLFRGDLILEQIVARNQSKHRIYFTVGNFPEDMLSLHNYLLKGALVNELSFCADRLSNELSQNWDVMKFEYLVDDTIVESPYLVQILNNYRFGFYFEIQREVALDNMTRARELVERMHTLIPLETLPYVNDQMKNFFDWFDN
ncbi:MAG: hypothetical protein AAGH79_10910 [Bacteroidota bacterium]